MTALVSASKNLDNNYMYNLTGSQLADHSDAWATALSLDPGPGNQAEGTSFNNPIVINVPGAEWDHLLNFLAGFRCVFCSWQRCDVLTVIGFRDDREEALRGIINQAVRWEMEGVAVYAFDRLAAVHTLSPVLQLEVGLEHDIREWVAVGFRRLVLYFPFTNLRRLDVERLGSYTLLILAQARWEIEMFRLALCFWTPRIHHCPTCPFKTGCRISWKVHWWNGFAKHLLNPNPASRRSPRDILEELYGLEVSFMCQGCKDLSVLAALEEPALDHENVIIAKAVSRLVGTSAD